MLYNVREFERKKEEKKKALTNKFFCIFSLIALVTSSVNSIFILENKERKREKILHIFSSGTCTCICTSEIWITYVHPHKQKERKRELHTLKNIFPADQHCVKITVRSYPEVIFSSLIANSKQFQMSFSYYFLSSCISVAKFPFGSSAANARDPRELPLPRSHSLRHPQTTKFVLPGWDEATIRYIARLQLVRLHSQFPVMVLITMPAALLALHRLVRARLFTRMRKRTVPLGDSPTAR